MVKERFRYCVGTGTLTIFDIDDTLFHTTAKVQVVKDDQIVRELTNSEFNTYELADGESFDFEQFTDAELFRKTSKPITKMVEKAKRVVKARGNPLSRAIIVTARNDFDNPTVFLQTFRDHGIPIDDMHVERSAKIAHLSTAERKKAVIRKYLNTRNYTKVRLYDDAITNLEGFLELEQEYPNIKFIAYLVHADGSFEEVEGDEVI